MIKNIKDIKLNKFIKIPDFKCPNCNIGNLKLNHNGLNESETYYSKKFYDLTGEVDYLFLFTGILECNECKECVIIGGEKFSDRNYNPIFLDENDNFLYEEEQNFNDMKNIGIDYINDFFYRIKYLYPSPNIIDIPEKVLNSTDVNLTLLKDTILESFNQFWIDENTCANKIRISIEILMNYYNIFEKNSKWKRLSLHKRISNFISIKNPIQGERLLAIKWIGNEGSHIGQKLSKNNLIEAYEILELILEKEFDEREKNIDLNVKKINHKRGVL